jgi:ABC-type transport system involved in cytochrome c biogenesis permease subunit
MRRKGRIGATTVAAWALAVVAVAGGAWALAAWRAASRADAPVQLGDGPAYRALGELAVLHRGRIKPLDTMARLEIEQTYGRGAPKVHDARGTHVATWGALGALVDWPLRPNYWDEQEILLIDLFNYRHFKEELLAEPIHDALRPIAAKPSTPAADRAAIEALLERDAIAEKDLKVLAESKALPEADRATIEGWAKKLAEGRKWIAPADLEAAVVSDGTRRVRVLDWYAEIRERARAAAMRREQFRPTPREQDVIDLGERLALYEVHRDRSDTRGQSVELSTTPRPATAAYLAYTGSIVRKLADGQGPSLSNDPLALDTVQTLGMYLEDKYPLRSFLDDVRAGKQKPPGEDPKFDRNYAKWLQTAAGWMPLRVIREADLDALERAGLPRARVEALRGAIAAFESSERANPGQAALAPAQSVVATARALGTTTNATAYPTTGALTREVHFNHFDPFAKAPLAYGAALVLLLISLGITAPRDSTAGLVGRFAYGLGLLAFVAGIGLEIYGFTLRVLISGWAPVTNMYETVIWVAFVAAVLGLVLELIFRRKYAAVAASGVALMATLLAATVPMLEEQSNIGALQPVLRDNYWLTVHVLTIVSSYAAFTLALGLGLLGLAYYLGATYRHDASVRSLAWPLLWGVPLLAGGIALLVSPIHQVAWFQDWKGTVLWLVPTIIGGMCCVAVVTALLGEFANRRSDVAALTGLALALAGGLVVALLWNRTAPRWWPEQFPLTFLPGALGLAGLGLTFTALLGGRSRAVLIQAQADQKIPMHELAEFADAARVPVAVGAAGKKAGGGRALAGNGNGHGRGRLSVAEIVRRASSEPGTFDPRTLAIQHTVGLVKPLSNFLYRAMQVGVLLVAAGTILGGVWADASWGRFWGWDAKEVWALITLLVYLVPLHGRFAGWVNAFWLVGASVLCYMAVLMAWYGVNFVINTGLHSYGFTEGGGQGVVFTTALAVIAVALGTGWRRSVGSRLVETA